METFTIDPASGIKRPEIHQANKDIIELIYLLKQVHQPNSEKYEIIKPIFERLNLYCDEQSIRFEKDSDCFAIPLDAVAGTLYDEEGDVLFILFKQNRSLHTFNLTNLQHIIYISPKQQNAITSFFLNIYHKIQFKIMAFNLRKQFKHYIKSK